MYMFTIMSVPLSSVWALSYHLWNILLSFYSLQYTLWFPVRFFSWARGLFARVPIHLQAFGHFPVTFLLLVSGWSPCMTSILSALRKPVPEPRWWSIQVPWSWSHGQSASFLHGSAFWHLSDIPSGVCVLLGGGTGKALSTPCQEANATLLTRIQSKYSHVYTR